MKLQILKSELEGDPLARGYAGMTAEEASDDMNTVYRTRNHTSMTGDEILNQVDTAEWGTRSAAEKQTVWDVCHLGSVDPFGVAATLLVGAFGGGSNTIVALAAARKEDVSRATELGLGFIHPGHIENARA